jgi:hypothetical protein
MIDWNKPLRWTSAYLNADYSAPIFVEQLSEGRAIVKWKAHDGIWDAAALSSALIENIPEPPPEPRERFFVQYSDGTLSKDSYCNGELKGWHPERMHVIRFVEDVTWREPK